MATKLRQWIFARPMVNDFLGPKQFELREVPIPELQQELALVRVKLVNIHSGTRTRMANRMTKFRKSAGRGRWPLYDFAFRQIAGAERSSAMPIMKWQTCSNPRRLCHGQQNC
jgi:hypothetical protein